MSDKYHSPAFSVVIPTYNRAHLVPRAIGSVLNQSFADFELLVVDDASPDETAEVIKSFQDPRIRYIRREDNGGVACALNTGITQSRGEYVSILGDDDEYLPDFLKETHRVLNAASETTGLSWCGTCVVQDTLDGELLLEDRGVWQPKFKDREHAYLSFLQSPGIGTNFGVTVRRSCFDSVGLFDKSLRTAEDTDFLIRLIRQFDFVVVPAVLVKLHRHGGPRLKIYDQRMGQAYEQIIQKHLETLHAHPRLWAALHYKTGWLYYHGGDKMRARKFMTQALQKYPFHLKSWTGLLLFETLGLWGPRLHKRMSVLRARFSF